MVNVLFLPANFMRFLVYTLGVSLECIKIQGKEHIHQQPQTHVYPV